MNIKPFPLMHTRAATMLAVLLFLLLAGGYAQAEEFRQKLVLQGVHFDIRCANAGSFNQLAIQPSGRIAKQPRIVREVFGTVVGAEVADLNADGWPEVYVYVRSAGSGSYGSIVGLSVNKGKSITDIYLPELADDAALSVGYQGHDEFAIVENTLARRFPIYRPGDSNGSPTGGKRQLHYRLAPGEAGWVMRLDPSKTTNF